MRTQTKETLIVLGVIAALVAGAAVLVYTPQKKKLAQLHKQIASEHRALDADGAKAKSVPGLVRLVESMKVRYKDFDRRLPKSRELFGFIEQIGKHLIDSKLSSHRIEPGKPAREDLFHTLPIIMHCAGGYQELSDFLARVDGSQRLARVEKLVARTRPGDDDLKIEVHMNIYFTDR